MLSIGSLRFGQQDYYLRSVAQGAEEYYVGHGEAPGRWTGALTAELRLDGTVTADALRAVLDGRDPADGSRLGRNRKHRAPGFDLTFNAPKSVSVLWALSDHAVSRHVRDAHDAAVAAALGYLERDACRTRRGRNGVHIVPATGFVGAAFLHRTNRNGDPQLHTHVLIANVTRAEDGTRLALDGRHLYLWAKTAGYLYEAHLRAELTRRLGVAWGPVRNGIADIDGVPDAMLKRFATRSDEIKAEMASAGLDSARAAQHAALKTRRAKDAQVDIVALHARWRDQAAELGVEPGDLTTVLRRAVSASLSQERVAAIKAELLGAEGLTKRASTFDRLDVLRAWCDRLPAGADLEEIEQLADHTLAALDIVPLKEGECGRGVTMRHQTSGKPMSTPTTGARYSTQELLDLEARLVHPAVTREDANVGVADDRSLLDALGARRELSAEQVELVVALTTSGRGVDVVVAAAGTGKTFSLDAARAAWHESGHTVIGCALAARAAAELQATTGIPSDTIARLLRELDQAGSLPTRTVLVVDEAGMAGTRLLARLLDHAHQANAKVVLVGDPAQLPAIDAGGLIRGLETRLPTLRLSENRRQYDAWERAALKDLRQGDTDTALAAYRDHGRIVTHDTAIAAREHLVADWHAATLRGEHVLMLAIRNADVDDLNARARHHLTSDGLLSGPALLIDHRPYQTGDRVMTLRNNRRLHVRNGSVGTIEHVDPADRTMRVRTDDTLVTLPSSYLAEGHVRHAYAMTIHKAQGQTADRALVLGSDLLFQEAGYVALSRGRTHNRLYLVEPQPREHAHAPEHTRRPLDALTHALSTSRAQRLAIETDIDTDAIRRAVTGLVHERRMLEHLDQQAPTDQSYEIAALEYKRQELANGIRSTHGELERLNRERSWRRRSTRAQHRLVLHHQLSNDTMTLRSLDDALERAHAAQAEHDAYLATHGQDLERLPDVHDAIEERLTQLVNADAAFPPSFLRPLGAPPEDSERASRWHDTARFIERYRIEHNITDPDRPLGPPPLGARRHLWRIEMERLEQLIHGAPEPAPPTGPSLEIG